MVINTGKFCIVTSTTKFTVILTKKLGQILVPPVTQLFRSKWLNFFYRCTERKIQSSSPKKLGQILVPPVTQLLGPKWLNYFSRCTERKIQSFWPKKLCLILIPPVTQLFKSKWLNFFSRCTERERIELFWPKKLGRIFVPPVTQLLRSKWLNFLSVHWKKKLSHFDPKSWVTWVETKTFKLKISFNCISYPMGNGQSSIIAKAVNKQNTSKLLL